MRTKPDKMIAGLKSVGGETAQKKDVQLRALNSDRCVKKKGIRVSVSLFSLYTSALRS